MKHTEQQPMTSGKADERLKALTGQVIDQIKKLAISGGKNTIPVGEILVGNERGTIKKLKMLKKGIVVTVADDYGQDEDYPLEYEGFNLPDLIYILSELECKQLPF